MNVSTKSLFIIQIIIITITSASVTTNNRYTDPDSDRTIAELITSRGFDYEVHYVTTDDSYILGVYRIINPFVSKEQRSKLRPVVLQHGFLSDGGTFLINSPDGYAVPCDPSTNGQQADKWLDTITDDYDDDDTNSTQTNNLGFLLGNRCYDVWLANSRGNQYSRNHTTLNPDMDRQYWQFSFDEMIQYDTPNLIDYILNVTQFQSLAWIGHSQGTLLMFGLLSEQPGYSMKVKPFIALAPVCFVSNILLALRVVSSIPGALWVLRKYGGELGDQSVIMSTTSQFICGRWEPQVCDNWINPFKGYTESLMNENRTDVFRLQQSRASSSVWNLVHYGQNVRSQSFAKFDYGTMDNLVHYGGPSPPKYTLSQINSTQIALFYSQADTLGDLKDVENLIETLKVPLFKEYKIPLPTWDHFDFIYADNLFEIVHSEILEVLKQSQLMEARELANIIK